MTPESITVSAVFAHGNEELPDCDPGEKSARMPLQDAGGQNGDRPNRSIRGKVYTPLLSSRTGATLSSREFNQDASRAKKAAAEGPVFITDRGAAPHVPLSSGEFQRITGKGPSIVDALSMPGLADIELDAPRV